MYKSKLFELKSVRTSQDLSQLLNIDYTDFKNAISHPEKNYTSFSIHKKSGGLREIKAPSSILKEIQKNLADLLIECREEIFSKQKINKKLSHGFEKDLSIITNAKIHRNKKNIINIDLEDFFGSINFGRVQGYFIKNTHFQLPHNIASTIARIACVDGKLPQGSPCSPVISNLIASILDIKLQKLAKRLSFDYTRYADDITFSSRLNKIPEGLALISDGKYIAGKDILKIINKEGFSININKTRVNNKNERQEVTGLVVNRKILPKREYCKKARAMFDSLRKHEYFLIEKGSDTKEGSIQSLYGILNHIDNLDRYHRINSNEKLNPAYKTKDALDINLSEKLNSRERIFSDFLFYINFIINNKPVLICEGDSDINYLYAASKAIGKKFKNIESIEDGERVLNIKFFKKNKRTRFLLNLYGGTSYLKNFIKKYSEKQKELKYDSYRIKNPVIIILDNDDGTSGIRNLLLDMKSKKKPDNKTYDEGGSFWIKENLYAVLISKNNGNDTQIEDLFDENTRSIKINGKTLSTEKEKDNEKHIGKMMFSNFVRNNIKSISFDGFSGILESIDRIIDHHRENT